jgi:cold shock protein
MSLAITNDDVRVHVLLNADLAERLERWRREQRADRAIRSRFSCRLPTPGRRSCSSAISPTSSSSAPRRRRSISTFIGRTPSCRKAVSWYNNQKGYGFIQPDDGGQEAFVHITAVGRAGMYGLKTGQKLAYELVKNKRNGKLAAENLRQVGGRT